MDASEPPKLNHDLQTQTVEGSISWPAQRPAKSSKWDPDTDRRMRTQETDIPTPRERTPSPTPKQAYIPISFYPSEHRSLSGISIRAFALGLTLGLSILLTIEFAFIYPARIWRTFFYLSALSLFHFLEFWTHARYNVPEATIQAFLLSQNGIAYNIANGTALLETTITSLFFQNWQAHWATRLAMGIGMSLVVIGQTARSTAMAQAGTNFNHHVQRKKRTDHVLVTSGIYACFRHPSYFGFYYWAVGTQMVIGNFISGILIGFVLWVFFNRRIKAEERFLINFFGDDYLRYRERTGTYLPFMNVNITRKIPLFLMHTPPKKTT